MSHGVGHLVPEKTILLWGKTALKHIDQLVYVHKFKKNAFKLIKYNMDINPKYE